MSATDSMEFIYESTPGEPFWKDRGVYVHPTAIVDRRAQLGAGTKVGPFSIVGPDVRMGLGNIIQSHVVIQNDVIMGDENVVWPFSVLGAKPADLKYRGERSRLVLGHRNHVRESCSLHLGTEGGGWETRLGDNNLLMAYVHLGHDTVIGNHSIIANGCQIAGHVTIEDHVGVGGLCGVSQFVRLGSHSYIGGCSGVNRDVVPFTLGFGPPGGFELKGLNLVGLKRRGFSSEAIGALQDAFRIFVDRDHFEKTAALEKIESQWGHLSEIQKLVEFARSSEVGLYR